VLNPKPDGLMEGLGGRVPQEPNQTPREGDGGGQKENYYKRTNRRIGKKPYGEEKCEDLRKTYLICLQRRFVGGGGFPTGMVEEGSRKKGSKRLNKKDRGGLEKLEKRSRNGTV